MCACMCVCVRVCVRARVHVHPRVLSLLACVGLARAVNMRRTLGDFPAINIVHTPDTVGSGQPCAMSLWCTPFKV